MKLSIYAFGRLRPIIGASTTVDAQPSDTVADVVNALCERYPTLDDALGGVAFALDDDVVPTDTPLGAARELSLLPPVSGG